MLKRHKDINPSMSVAELITTDQKLKKKKTQQRNRKNVIYIQNEMLFNIK